MDTVLDDISQTEKEEYCMVSFRYKIYKQKKKHKKYWYRILVTRGRSLRVDKIGKRGQKVKPYSYTSKINKSWGCNLQQEDYKTNNFSCWKKYVCTPSCFLPKSKSVVILLGNS